MSRDIAAYSITLTCQVQCVKDEEHGLKSTYNIVELQDEAKPED